MKATNIKTLIAVVSVILLVAAALISSQSPTSAAFGGIIGGIVGAVGVALNRKTRSNGGGSLTNNLLLAALLLGAAAASAQAQPFVSARNGVDVGTCPLSAPCRSISYSLTQAAEGGAVNIIDSGVYDSFVVTKSLTVQAAPGVVAVITRNSIGPGVTIETEVLEYVTIRGLTLNLPNNLLSPSPSAVSTGFILTGSGTALIDRCVVRGFAIGIDSKMNGWLVVRDTQLSGGATGISLSPGASILKASIERCATYRTVTVGLNVGASPGAAVRLSVIDSQFTGLNRGVRVAADAAGGADVNLENCLVTSNRLGLSADGVGATIKVSNSTITENDFGIIATSGATLLSRGNNTVEGNSTDGAFSGVFAAR